MRTRNATPFIMTHLNSLILVGVFIILAAVVAAPVYSVRSGSLSSGSSQASVPPRAPANIRPVKSLAASSANLAAIPSYSVNLPSITGETIAIYAADCSTPKDSFNLGEVVCAKTDGVDLITTPNNYYVNWDGPSGDTNGGTITQNPQYFLFALPTSPTGNVGTWKANIGSLIPPESSIIGLPPLFTVSEGLAIGIFASNCTTPKSVFNLQDADPGKTVCAKVTGATDPTWRIIWSNANGEAVQDVPVGTGESTFTLTAGSSLGDWRVILYEPFGGSVYAVSPFTVIDAENPSADISISKGTISSTVAAGSQVVFTVQVTNLGPDAATVQITDAVPTNTTFYEFAPTSAPVGTNCVKPAVGATSPDVVCTIPTLARGETAVFLATYTVISGTPTNTVISNTGTVASVANGPNPAVPDPNSTNNSSTATATVTGSVSETCTLGSPEQPCPANVVVTANTTQGAQFGAFVTYGAASGSGNCGAITNNPASGSFFAVGTYSVVSTSELGAASCSFTVTVLDTNPPTITCPPNQTIQLSSGQTEANGVNPGTPTINASGGGTVTGVRSDDTQATYDENGNVIISAVVHSLTADPYPIGSTGILRTVTDAGGRTASCTQIITVVAAGNRPPVTISCPANVSANAPSGSCEATILAADIGTPTTNPSDSQVLVAAVRSDGMALLAPFPAGVTIITWTASDTVGTGEDAVVVSVASCTQNITVIAGSGSDTTAPTLVVPANVTATTSSCTAILDDELGAAEAFDSGACGGSVTITRSGVPAGFVFPTGTTVITYSATDAAGNTATGTQLVTVTESPAIPPTITAPADVTLYTGPGATSCSVTVSDLNATLGTATANDNCPGVTVARSNVPAGNVFPLGNTTITYTATDRSGNTASDQQVVTVVDNTAPVITLNSFAPSMWPPNHKYKTFGLTQFVTGVTDSCDTTLGISGVVIEKVTSDEIENGNGDGNTLNDIVIATDCKSVQLRSEREGSGNGRVYTIFFKATDASGNVGTATAKVVVQHNPGETAINSGVHYTVTCGGP